ncbi:MAG TPA: aminoglycoside phosphotransferase family protein [Longimicrobiaceae bacterium]|nr:aminoglycoside phosphotransferase family protein [Longimicrobiaceae bacterium]
MTRTATASTPVSRADAGSNWPGLDALLRVASRQVGGAPPREIVHPDGNWNHVAEVRFGRGRTLMLKRARDYPETAAERFENARNAATFLRERAGVTAPEHLAFPLLDGEVPVESYWRVPLPVLKELWPALSEPARERALRSWGELLARIHAVPAHGSGVPLLAGGNVRGDLEGRLLPAIRGVWAAAAGATERLAQAAPAAQARAARRTAVLVHGDMHMGNVFCTEDGEEVLCVGLLDLEEAFSAPAEADWAIMELMHGPLFGMPLPDGWLETARAGYGRELDPALLAFFRAYRLLNLGVNAAATGLDAHASQVAAAVGDEVQRLEALLG